MQNEVLTTQDNFWQMEADSNFINFIAHDLTAKILLLLDDPGDVVRASSVSRCWHDFIVSNGTAKQLCLRMFPQLSSIARIVYTNNGVAESVDGECSSSNQWGRAKMEHRIFSLLAHNLLSSEACGCISAAISASSTDNYPEESIRNTLDPRDRIGRRASYWSSSGQKNPDVPEKLTYKLISDFCVVTEINVQPFQAFFQLGYPIYSARSVRFHMGHQILPDDAEGDILDSKQKQPGDDKFVWTYTSPVFPMAQENTLQSFKLPEPALCIGGILQIELIGRVQRQDMDSMFYICVAHVQVVGYSLSPVFSAQIMEPSGKFALVYNPQAQFCTPQAAEVSDETFLTNLSPEMLGRHARGWEQIFDMLRGNLALEVYMSDDEHHESDDDFPADFDA